jgi:hypothetical protein
VDKTTPPPGLSPQWPAIMRTPLDEFALVIPDGRQAADSRTAPVVSHDPWIPGQTFGPRGMTRRGDQPDFASPLSPSAFLISRNTMAYDSVFVKSFLSTARDSENRRTSVGSALFGVCGAVLVTLGYSRLCARPTDWSKLEQTGIRRGRSEASLTLFQSVAFAHRRRNA